MKKQLLLFLTMVVCVELYAQTDRYVKPDAPSGGSGTLASPYNDIVSAVNIVKNAGGGNVIIVNGTYDMPDSGVKIKTAATSSTQVTIKPQSTAGVKLNFNGRYGFEFDEPSRYITLKGLELDGETDEIDFWSIVSQAFWGDASIPRNGGLAIILDGQHITIEDNYIHDWYQKAVEIRDGRYVVVKGNIIHDIATTSLSGGHGIMRQQKGVEYTNDDTPGIYRWDIYGNLIFRVEQRIYSWVPSKGYIEMVIDEGKSILIDDPKDTDGNQEAMSARIKNNVVAYGSVDGIRLKSTPNLEVSQNSVYQTGPDADGITDKAGDTNTPQFTGFKFVNNASQTFPWTSGVNNIQAIDIVQAVQQGGNTITVSGNVGMDGKVVPGSQSGISRLTNQQLFTDPANGDFSINSSLNLPSTLGVESAVLSAMNTKKSNFGVTVSSGSFVVDHLKTTQTILDNIPGINDGISNNETVFTNHGTMSSNHEKITFSVVNGTWKNNTGSRSTQEFRLNEVYHTWYSGVDQAHKNASNNSYERIRWGDSEVKQDQVFDADWLTVCQIKGTSSHTLLNGHNNDFTLDGDILIDFEGFTPSDNDSFDLMKANSITSANSGSLFDRVIFEGFTPNNYDLSVVTVSGKKVLRLIVNPSATTYTLTTSATNGSVSPSSGTYAANASVSLTATANNGYQFSGWSGDASGSNNPLTITMDGNKSITANFTAVSSSTTTTLSPIDDAHVRNGSNNTTNYGSYANLQIRETTTSGAKRLAFLKFDLSNISNVTSATLRISNTGSNGDILLKKVDSDNWSESSVTWATKPSNGSTIGTYTLNGSGYHELDVTNYVSAEANGDDEVSFVLKGSTSNFMTISSKEGNAAPQLVVEYGSSARYASENVTLNVDDLEKNRISVYPNPTNSLVNLQISDADVVNGSIKIYDLSGLLLSAQPITGSFMQLQLDGSMGVYLIKIQNNGVSTIRRIAKQ